LKEFGIMDRAEGDVSASGRDISHTACGFESFI